MSNFRVGTSIVLKQIPSEWHHLHEGQRGRVVEQRSNGKLLVHINETGKRYELKTSALRLAETENIPQNIDTNFLRQYKSKQTPKWEEYYLDYQSLDMARLNIQSNKLNAEKKYTDLLDTEVTKCNKFYTRMAKNLITKDKNSLKQKGDDVSQSIQSIEDFALLNVDALQRIIMSHDAVSQYPLRPAYVWKMKRETFCSPLDLQPLFMHLSKLYEKERGNSEQKGEKVVRKNFERTSLKFWIKQEDIVRFICLVLRYLAVYTYKEDGDFAQGTSSVYFDRNDMNYYKRRLDKEEGSTLIRFRWYGTLGPGSKIFIERKTHHESWVTDPSIKQRCTIPQEGISDYVKGKQTVSDNFLKENPIYSEIQSTIIKTEMRPAVKTVYMRTAFQLPHDDSIRLTLDTNLEMFRELDSATLSSLRNWHTPNDQFGEQSVHRFPFAVLEIKLHKETLANKPQWLSQLMRKGGLIIEMEKFSKFCHGCAVLYPEKIQKLPYWFSDDEYGPLFKSINTGSSNVINPTPELKIDVSRPHGLTLFSPPKKDALVDYTMNPLHNPNSPNSALKINESKAMSISPFESKDPEEIEPLLFQNEMFEKFQKYDKCGCLPCISKCYQKDDKKFASRIKIEPKTFFANERTFLQWFNAATLVASVGLALIGLSNTTIVYVGYFLVPASMVMLVYSLCVFHWRSHSLKNRSKNVSYTDLKGPTFLVIILSITFLVALIMHWDVEYIGCKVHQKPLSMGAATGLVRHPANNKLFGIGTNTIFVLNPQPPSWSQPSSTTLFQLGDSFVPVEMDDQNFPRMFSNYQDITVDETGLLYVASNYQNESSILRIDPNSHLITRKFNLSQPHIYGLTYHAKLKKFYAGDSSGDVHVYDLPADGSPSMTYDETITPMKGSGKLTSISSFSNNIVYHYTLPTDVHTAMFFDGMTSANYLGKFKTAVSADTRNFGNEIKAIAFTDPYGYDTKENLDTPILATALTYSRASYGVFQYRIENSGHPKFSPSCTNV